MDRWKLPPLAFSMKGITPLNAWNILNKSPLTIQGPKVESPTYKFLHGEIYSRQSQTPKSICCWVLQGKKNIKLPVHNATKMGRIPPWQCQTMAIHSWGSWVCHRHWGSTKPFNDMDCALQSMPKPPAGLHARENVQLNGQLGNHNHTYMTCIKGVCWLQKAKH